MRGAKSLKGIIPIRASLSTISVGGRRREQDETEATWAAAAAKLADEYVAKKEEDTKEMEPDKTPPD